mgnify:CR=1 FL=1
MTGDDKGGLIKAAVEQSDLPTVLTTADLDWPGPKIICVSDAYTRLTGYARDELIGATPRLQQGSATDRAVLDRLRANLRAGIVFEGSTWNYRKDGTPYFLEWAVTPLRLASGSIDYFFSIQREISEYRSRPAAPLRFLDTSLQALRNDSDPVTGAQTRQSMLRCLQRSIDAPVEPGATTGLIKLQLKRLERLNKVFSLGQINHLLSDIAERIAGVCDPSGSLARSHEYTFAITIPGITGSQGDIDEYLNRRARALIAAITGASFRIGDQTLEIEVNAGIGQAPLHGQNASDLAVLVDEAAQCGDGQRDSNCICWADPAVIERESRHLGLERDLRRAVSDNKIEVYYQPIVNLGDGKIIGAEALARWPQPAGQPPVGPDEFIPLAESLGLIERLGLRVFGQACRQLRDFQRRSGNEAFFISVNVSPSQLLDRNLADRLVALTRSTGVSPARLKLEITENALEQDSDIVRGIINDLVTAGFSLAVDDFGKGHSSLERVISLPFSLLKVDRSFIWQTPDGPGAGVVAGLVKLAEHLELSALGEGVETAAHEAYLRDCRYLYAQGFLYGKPVAAEDFPL